MKLTSGINLGGYLSQCVHTPEHYRQFITENDIKQIAEWGFDHIRLPIDYEVLENEDGTVRASGYLYVDKVIEWCAAYHLNIILDLHKAYGYDFNNAGSAEKNNLFSNINLQNRFINLWTVIAERYAKCPHVAMELLNEVVEEENAEAWNRLIAKAVKKIREIAKETPIIYGGICWNSAKTLKYLDVPESENIIFTFHFYEPLLFTHQKAPWVAGVDKAKDIFYPETMDYFRKQSAALGIQGGAVKDATTEKMGPAFIAEMVEEAVKAAKNAGVPLYCGEFGVIDRAPVKDTLQWFTDVKEVFRKHNIGCAVWTYKEKDFGLTDSHYDEIREDLVALLTNHAFSCSLL